jgi:DNA replication initiation complex subunit (GINS family)
MSSCQHLPEDVYNKVSKIRALTCDEINSLTFNRKDPHDRVLLKMQEALQLQTRKIYNRSPDRFMNRYERRQEDDSSNSMGGIRIIQS